jgi:hypothetical protein
MPRLTFPIATDGLLVPVLVGLETAILQDLLARGVPLPRPAPGVGLSDTGTTITAVVPRTLAAIGAVSFGQATTTTAAGQVAVQLYRVSLTRYDPIRPPADTFGRGTVFVTDLAHDLPGVAVLIGLDLIRELVLTVDGPAGQFALSF